MMKRLSVASASTLALALAAPLSAQTNTQVSPTDTASPAAHGTPATANGANRNSGGTVDGRAPPTQATVPAGVPGDIVVTAQRRAESLARTPVAISVVTAETLREKAITTEADLQSTVPGLIIKTGQNDNQINFSLRGQTVDPFSSSTPSVLPYFNEVQVGGVGATALYDLSSVQVLKGPQGTLFGRNSTGGAVLYTSQQPTNDFGGYVVGRAGDWSAKQLEGAVNVPLVDHTVLLRVAGFIQRRDGFQYNLFDGTRLGEVKRENVRASLTIKPTAAITNDLVVDYGHSSGASLSSVVYNVLPLGSPAFVPFNFLFSPAADSVLGAGSWASYLAAHPKADPLGLIHFAAVQAQRGPYVVNVDSPNYYKQNKVILSNITAFEVAPGTTIKNVLGYVHTRFAGAGEFDGTVYGGDANGPDGRRGIINQFSDELQVVGQAFGSRLDYVGGLYYSHQTDNTRSQSIVFDLSPVSPPVNQINNGEFTNNNYAVYAQGTYDLGLGGLKLTAGGRYTIETTRFNRAADDTYVTSPNAAYNYNQRDTFRRFSWTVGLDDQVTSELLLYVKSRRSFRSGGFNYFAPPTGGFGSATGGEYRPETATDVEGGAKYHGALGTMPVRANLAIYNTWVDDIQRAFYAAIFGNLAAITVNVPKAEVFGIEYDASINPTPWLTLGGSANYTNPRFTQNAVNVVGNPQAKFDTYPDTPTWSGAAFGDVQVPLTSRLTGTARADLYVQSHTFFSSTAKSLTTGARLPGYATVNLRVGIADKQAGWSLAGVVKNLGDRTYYTGGVGFANIFSLNTAVPGDRRTILVELGYRF
jgi:iron complex outermembrane receptor protein